MCETGIISKYMGKSDEWYFGKALSALAGDPDWHCNFSPNLQWRAGHVYVNGYTATLERRTKFLLIEVHTFNAKEAAALRAQRIYHEMVRKLGGTK